MYKTRVTPNVKSNISQPTQTQIVSNPIHREAPTIKPVESKQDVQYRIITSIMFWTLGAIAITLFYRALTSLML